ncbi:MAG: flavodoxin-dependent (E)-4-hydroxy-3-methylbut-2-enyl-diphosphate synthase [candidate division WOR-3 bacterium]
MTTQRLKTKPVKVGKIQIGGGAPIVVQSMTKTRTENVKATIAQIRLLENANCEIVRVAIPTQTAAKAIKQIKTETKVPIVADIHFDYRLALLSIKYGADKIRINPGNIGAKWKVIEIIKIAKDYNVPIRIGVNVGSLEKTVCQKYPKPNTKALLESVARTVEIFEKSDFTNLVLSAKAFDGLTTIETYEAMADLYPYPLHLGITEAGLAFEGAVRSTGPLAILLAKGIGDTIRISLTADPVLEVIAGYELLQCLGLREYGPIIISCPTCGRCEVNLVRMAEEVKQALRHYKKPLKIAVMGCIVNGPGEAKNADFGIAVSKKSGIVFAHGKVIKRCDENELVSSLLHEIEKANHNGD